LNQRFIIYILVGNFTDVVWHKIIFYIFARKQGVYFGIGTQCINLHLRLSNVSSRQLQVRMSAVRSIYTQIDRSISLQVLLSWRHPTNSVKALKEDHPQKMQWQQIHVYLLSVNYIMNFSKTG